MHEWTCCCDEAANQSAVAYSCNLLNHPNSFHGGMFKLNAKFDAESLFYLVILNVTATQDTCSLDGRLLPPLISMVKSSLFTHVHSIPLSLAARLHQCRANRSRYINNGWTFSGQTS